MSRYCLTPRCATIVDGRSSYCDEHQPRREPWRGSKSEARGWEWTRIRKRILIRDQRRCQEVMPGGTTCGAPASQVDAIVPSARGGSHHDPKNLRALCEDHHKAKTEQDRRDGIAARKVR